MRSFALLAVGVLVSGPLSHVPAQQDGGLTGAVSVLSGELVWRDGPQGRKIAVLYGDPSGEGPFVIRVKFPAGHRIARHYHPTTEFGTVLSGTVHFQVGRAGEDLGPPRAYPRGSFFAGPAGLHIAGWTEEETIVQVHGTGPFRVIPVEETGAASLPGEALAAQRREGSTEENRELVRYLFQQVWNGRNHELVEQLFAPDFRFVPPGQAEATDRDGFKRYLGMFQEAFPDAQWHAEELVGEGERVAFRVNFRGTHRGQLQDIPPTGRQVSLVGFGIFHLRDGKVQELRGMNDRLGLLQQLGALKEPADGR